MADGGQQQPSAEQMAEHELPEEQEEVAAQEPVVEARSSAGSADEAVTDTAVADGTPVSRTSTSSVVSSASSHSTASLERIKSEEIAPLVETTPDDIKNFCATQACAQPDDVVTLAKATLETLTTLWNEIGLEAHECNNSTAEMFAEVKRVFENKLSSTQEIKCSLVSQVRLASARITTIERETGTTQDESRMEACKANETLRGALAAHKEYLKSLEATKISRAGSLSKKADELSALFHVLDDSITPEQTKFLKLGSDYTMGRIEQFVTRIAEQKMELSSREHQRAELVEHIRALWVELGMKEEWERAGAGNEPEDWADVIVKAGKEDEIKVTMKNIEKLQDRVAKLQEEKVFRQSEQARLFGVLEALWDRTRVPTEESETFKGSHQDLTLCCLETIEVDIARLEEVKRAMMKELVGEVREVLSGVWDDMRYNDDDRQFFRHFYEDIYTEETLELHEEHLSACKERLDSMQPILKMFDRRAFILLEDVAMKESLADPNRLLGRGRGMAEQLKKEERVRNMVNKELPKLRITLRAAVEEYESSVGLNLKVAGERIIDVLDLEDEVNDAAKDEAKVRKAEKSTKTGLPSTSGTSAAGKTTPRERTDSKVTPRDRDASKERDASQERPGSANSASSRPGSASSKLRVAAKAVSKAPLSTSAKTNDADAAHAKPKCVAKFDLKATTSSSMPPPPSKETAGGVFAAPVAPGAENEGPDGLKKPSPRMGFGFKTGQPKGAEIKVKRTIMPKAT